jgi:integrative and conjugative element protein (TIGR02256 family)
VDVPERTEDVLLHECGRPVIPASAIDLSLVSSFVARKALDVLQSKSDLKNHLLWSRDSATDIHPSFDKSFSTIEMSFEQRPDCPACQEPDVTTVVITPEIREIIRKEVEASTTAETGGILIGYIENRNAIVVRATGPGPNAKQTPYIFERDVNFVQQELDRAAKELGERGLYIGEWHSHLVASPEPSGQDVESLCGIAQAPNYATRCPAMIIAGLDKEKGKLADLKCWTFPTAGRVCDGYLVHS